MYGHRPLLHLHPIIITAFVKFASAYEGDFRSTQPTSTVLHSCLWLLQHGNCCRELNWIEFNDMYEWYGLLWLAAASSERPETPWSCDDHQHVEWHARHLAWRSHLLAYVEGTEGCNYGSLPGLASLSNQFSWNILDKQCSLQDLMPQFARQNVSSNGESAFLVAFCHPCSQSSWAAV